MSARAFLVIFVLYLMVAFGCLVYHLSVDPSGASAFVLLHIFNICIGGNGIAKSVAFGLTYGWKS